MAMKCIGFERLIDYLDGQLAGKEKQPAEAHLLTDCKKCAASKKWYQTFKQAATTVKTIEPPPWVLRRAVRLVSPTPVKETAVVRVARGIAKLLFDSFTQSAAAGARSAQVSQRQLLYWIDDYNVDLQIAAIDELNANLFGQVLSTDEPGFDSVARITINLAQAGKTICSTFTNDLGEFKINAVNVGEYDLQIDTRKMTINILGLPFSTSVLPELDFIHFGKVQPKERT